MIRVTTVIVREIVGWDTPMMSAIASWEVLVHRYINVARGGQWAKNAWRQDDLGISHHYFHQPGDLRSVQARDTLTHDGSFLKGFCLATSFSQTNEPSPIQHTEPLIPHTHP
jgi:hypothetical protein